jgi:hypothetical protein
MSQQDRFQEGERQMLREDMESLLWIFGLRSYHLDIRWCENFVGELLKLLTTR